MRMPATCGARQGRGTRISLYSTVVKPTFMDDEDYWVEMPAPSGHICTMSDVLLLARKCQGYWFRGHSRPCEQLEPQIFRSKIDVQRWLVHTVESDHILNFQRLAPAYLDRPPAHDDYVSWLLYMQHYGTPTRLLDWSEGVLTALYFALLSRNSEETDGEMWIMNPDRLNAKTTKSLRGRAIYYASEVRMIGRNSVDSDIREIERRFEGSFPTGPVAFLPPALFPRLVAQSGAFTIHPKPEAGSRLAEVCGPADASLGRYLIPAESKNELRKHLTALGITRTSLFPDLDSLSQTIVQNSYTVQLALKEFPNINPSGCTAR